MQKQIRPPMVVRVVVAHNDVHNKNMPNILIRIHEIICKMRNKKSALKREQKEHAHAKI